MILPQDVWIFVCGCGGSIAVEIINLHSVYQQDTIIIPERYKKPGYYVVRLFLTLLAGGLTLAYKIDQPLLALNIGAATPVLIQTFAHGLTAATQAAVRTAEQPSALAKAAVAESNPDGS